MKRKTKLLSVLLTLTMGIATLGTMAGCGLFDSDKNSSSSNNTETHHNGNSSNTNTDQDDPIPPTGTQGLRYTLSDDETYYSVSGYTGTDTKVYIPDTYNDLPVKEITTTAFRFCRSLTEIIVSENNTEYKSIDGNLYSANGKKLICYAHGKNTTKFTIPDGVLFIGDYAFVGSNSLTEIIIPDGVSFIGESAFDSCDSLTSVTIGNNVTSIGKFAFAGCDSLTSVTIPESVTSIGWNAFDCNSLTIYCEAEIQPDSWGSIWNDCDCPVVWDCKNSDVTTDGFIYTIINSVRYALKDGIATVVRQASNITSANISSSIAYKGTQYDVTFIDSYAFKDCDILTSVTIGNGVTSIGYRVFYDCDSLTSVTIGSGITSIEDEVFFSCASLASVKFEDTSTWYVTNRKANWQNQTDGILVDVSDDNTNAMYFTDIYRNYYWYKL